MFYLAKETEDSAEFLIDEGSRKYYPIHRECEPTLQQLAEYCDQEAENANYHDFVGAHEALAEIIDKEAGAMAARRIMEVIAECGGLHEMGR